MADKPSSDDKVKKQLKNTMKASTEDLKKVLAARDAEAPPSEEPADEPQEEPAAKAAPAKPAGGLERLLGVFAEVHGGEGPSALLLTLNVFMLLTAYSVIKPIRNTMISGMPGGDQYGAYLSAAIALLLLGVVPAYTRFAKTLPRNRLIIGATLFFMSNLVIFAVVLSNQALRTKAVAIPAFLHSVLPTTTLQIVPVIFYIWVGIFNMMVVAQFWAFANDIYNEEQGKRLFAVVGIGASVGAVVGAGVVKTLAKKLEIWQLFLIAASLLVATCLLTQLVHTRETRTPKEKPKAKEEAPKPPAGGAGAFEMVLKYRYLMLLAAFMLTFTLVNTNGENLVSRMVKEFMDSEVARQGLDPAGEAATKLRDELGADFFGGFTLGVNVLSLVLQMFVVSRLVKFAGLKATFFVFPVIAFLSAGAVAIIPVLAVLRVGKVLENSTDYSINNTVRNMLWLPTTRAMKYQAKQAVDTFFVRMGDVGSAVLVFVLWGVMKLSARSLAVSSLAFIGLWLVLAAAIMREYTHLKKMRESGELKEEMT
jgi:AAA family ATP:ADP antiporter